MTGIDLSKSEQYTLSIRLSADGFSFSIHENGEAIFYAPYKVNPSYSMTANIKEMITASGELKHPYHRVNILIDSSRFTAIPFELFEDEQIETLFYHNFPKTGNETILCNILGKSNVALLFGMDKHAHQLLGEHFPQARIFACISPLMEHFSQKSREDQCRNLYAHFHKNQMEVFAFDKGKLILVNTYGCKQTADKVYYLLYVWQQLGFSQENDQLWLAGTLHEREELLDELRKFLRHANVIQAKENVPFDLETLMICE